MASCYLLQLLTKSGNWLLHRLLSITGSGPTCSLLLPYCLAFWAWLPVTYVVIVVVVPCEEPYTIMPSRQVLLAGCALESWLFDIPSFQSYLAVYLGRQQKPPGLLVKGKRPRAAHCQWKKF